MYFFKVENSNQSLQEQLDELKRKISITESLLESTRVISSLNIIEVFEMITTFYYLRNMKIFFFNRLQ